jgi:hypothetical protein
MESDLKWGSCEWDTIAVTLIMRPIGVKPWHYRLHFSCVAIPARQQSIEAAPPLTPPTRDQTRYEDVLSCRLTIRPLK